jgi:CRP/FNR family transcriptional regulator, cyclic AMP receptor protein
MQSTCTQSTFTQTTFNASIRCNGQSQSAGESLNALSPDALKELAALQHQSSYPANSVLFAEKDTPQGVFLVLEGEIKLSMNSSDGRRLILRIARKGELIGLTSTLTGLPYEMTAEAIYTSRVAFITRRDFIVFMASHPDVYQAITAELSRHYTKACEQLRNVGLSSSAPAKLARLLLDWSENGQTTEAGTRFRFSLTHEEIGEFIGTSRETVTRTLSVFKTRRLVNFKGSTLTIPNKTALATYAGF